MFAVSIGFGGALCWRLAAFAAEFYQEDRVERQPMKPNDKAYKEFMRVYNKTHVSLEAQVMASLTAAYAAQFQREDYAGLVDGLREWAGQYEGITLTGEKIIGQAADAIEVLLAKLNKLKPSDDYADLIRSLRGEPPTNSTLDPLRAAEAIEAVLAERDGLKAELDKAQEIARMQAERIGGYIKTIEDRDAERDALAAIRLHIEAAERERCAMVCRQLDKRAEAEGVAYPSGFACAIEIMKSPQQSGAGNE